jgi:hypothetical protein
LFHQENFLKFGLGFFFSFFSQYYDVVALVIQSIRGISQIWLQLREESKKNLRILLYFDHLVGPTSCLNMAISEKNFLEIW